MTKRAPHRALSALTLAAVIAMAVVIARRLATVQGDIASTRELTEDIYQDRLEPTGLGPPGGWVMPDGGPWLA